MRSSKNRSRSKGNRNRSVGNIVNRVFDSSGPEGKVRGTPQQIIDKYNQLTRDAQLSNDRVAAENFQQHAEHYLRLLSEAQREQEARREQQQAQQNQGGKGGGQPSRGEAKGTDEAPKPAPTDDAAAPVAEAESAERPFDAVIDPAEGAEAGPVETPEAAPKPKRARRPRRKPAGDEEATAVQADEAAAPRSDSDDQSPQEAAE